MMSLQCDLKWSKSTWWLIKSVSQPIKTLIQVIIHSRLFLLIKLFWRNHYSYFHDDSVTESADWSADNISLIYIQSLEKLFDLCLFGLLVLIHERLKLVIGIQLNKFLLLWDLDSFWIDFFQFFEWCFHQVQSSACCTLGTSLLVTLKAEKYLETCTLSPF